MNPLDIWRVAKQLIDVYGYNDAISLAALKADKMLDKGDIEGYKIWKDILKIIEWMQDGKIKS